MCCVPPASCSDLGPDQASVRGPSAADAPVNPGDRRKKQAVQGGVQPQSLWHPGVPEEHVDQDVSVLLSQWTGFLNGVFFDRRLKFANM